MRKASGTRPPAETGQVGGYRPAVEYYAENLDETI